MDTLTKLDKCQVIVPGRVWYQKAEAVLFGEVGGPGKVEVYNLRGRLLDTIEAPAWSKGPGKDWEFTDAEGNRIAYVEITGGCRCGGTQITILE